MADLAVDAECVRVRLRLEERLLAGQLRDVRIDYAQVDRVWQTDDGRSLLRGHRCSPAASLPGFTVGQWRHAAGIDLMLLHGGGPVTVLELTGHRYARLALTTEGRLRLVASPA